MKLLVVSLLRLGDILMAAPVLRSLKREYPNAEIHILINGQFSRVARLIPSADKVYCFDRDGLQHIIGTADRGLLEAYFRVEDLTEQLRAEKYDQVFNLTHNRISGWLTALIGCPKTHGVMFGANGKFYVGSRWFEYLNDIAETNRQNTFHYVDVFHYGAGLENHDRRLELSETDDGIRFAEKFLSDKKGSRRVLIQTGSHEQKKTFSVSKWKDMTRMIAGAEPDADIFLLGAPSESARIHEIAEGSRAVPVICGLEEAFSLIQRSQLLITVDTSIKHLAAASRIRVIEISLGSSDYRRTGVYTSGAIIVQGLSPCAPCPHRGPCSRPTHECAEKISPELVTLLAGSVMRGDENAMRVIAHEFKDEALVLKTKINVAGDWSAYPMARHFSTGEIARWIDRASFKLHLQRAHERTVGEFGSEGLELKRLLQNIFPDQSWREWVSELKQMESNMTWFENRIGEYLNELKAVIGHIQQATALDLFMHDLSEFGREMEKSPVLSSYGRQIQLSVSDSSRMALPFQAVKNLREKLSTAHQRTKIELKLIRGLQTGFMEII